MVPQLDENHHSCSIVSQDPSQTNVELSEMDKVVAFCQLHTASPSAVQLHIQRDMRPRKVEGADHGIFALHP